MLGNQHIQWFSLLSEWVDNDDYHCRNTQKVFCFLNCLPTYWACSTDMQGSWNRVHFSPKSWSQLYRSMIHAMHMASLLKVCWVFHMVSAWVSTSFWQNLMQNHCSNHLSLSWQMKTCRIFTTLTHRLAATYWRPCLWDGVHAWGFPTPIHLCFTFSQFWYVLVRPCVWVMRNKSEMIFF